MDLYKLSALANIGSFLLACVIAYLMLSERRSQSSATEGAMKSVAPRNLLTWVFIGGMVISGFLHFAAGKIHISEPPKSGTKIPAVIPSATPKEPPARNEKLEERIFVNPAMTSSDLRDIAGGWTQLSGEKKTIDYIGKWIRFSGVVAYIDSYAGTLNVAFYYNRGDPIISANFESPFPPRVTSIKVDQTIEVVCQIEGISSTFVTLRHCEFP